MTVCDSSHERKTDAHAVGLNAVAKRLKSGKSGIVERRAVVFHLNTKVIGVRVGNRKRHGRLTLRLRGTAGVAHQIDHQQFQFQRLAADISVFRSFVFNRNIFVLS